MHAQSCLTLVTPWTVAHQAPLSMEFLGKNTGVSCHCQLNPGAIEKMPEKSEKVFYPNPNLQYFLLPDCHTSIAQIVYFGD